MRKKLITKEVTEDFWRDCLDIQDVKSSSEYMPYRNNPNENKKGRNNLKQSKNNNNYINIIQNHRKKKNIAKFRSNNNNKTIENESFMKVYKNHPILQENVKTNKFDKELEMRKKNAMNRCLGLYAYGIEVKKQKLLDDENNKKEKIKDEITPCTFRPKIGKYSNSRQNKINPENYFNYNKKSKNKNNKGNSNGDYRIVSSSSYDNGVNKNTIKIKNQNKTIAHDEQDISYLDKYTFKPKIPRKNIKKVFGKSKSLANEKDNAEFFLRYARAREEYMIKKFKKISIKDDSYDTTLLSLANRFNNKQYKNGLNNNYDIKNKNNYNRMNLSMDSPIEKKNNYIDKDIINNLRNDLLTLDLNEED